MNQRVVDIAIRGETKLSDQSVELFPLVGKSQAGTALEYEGVSEVVGCGCLVLGGLLEHEEEEGKGVEMMGRVGTMGISSNDGVVVVRVETRVRVEEKTSVGEVAGGGESGESEELGEVPSGILVLGP